MLAAAGGRQNEVFAEEQAEMQRMFNQNKGFQEGKKNRFKDKTTRSNAHAPRVEEDTGPGIEVEAAALMALGSSSGSLSKSDEGAQAYAELTSPGTVNTRGNQAPPQSSVAADLQHFRKQSVTVAETALFTGAGVGLRNSMAVVGPNYRNDNRWTSHGSLTHSVKPQRVALRASTEGPPGPGRPGGGGGNFVNTMGHERARKSFSGDENYEIKLDPITGQWTRSESGRLHTGGMGERLSRRVTQLVPRRVKTVVANVLGRAAVLLKKRVQKREDTLAFKRAAAYYQKGNIIHPKNVYVGRWDLVVSGLMAYSAIVTPFEVSFLTVPVSHLLFSPADPLFCINLLVDLGFACDIALNFFLGFWDEETGTVVTDPALVRLHYFKGWFFVDCLSIFPFNYISLAWRGTSDQEANERVIGGLRAVRLLKLLRLAKLLRVLRAGRIFRRWESSWNINYALMKLLKFLFLSSLLAHWMACAFNLVADVEDADQNWLDASGVRDAAPGTVYNVAMYWAVMTMSTIGFGDVTPVTNTEICATTLGMLIGASAFAYMLGSMCSIIATMNVKQTVFYQAMDDLNLFMKDKRLPMGMRQRLREFLRYRRDVMVVNEHILAGLSPGLRAEVSVQTNKDWLNRVPFFCTCPESFIVDISTVLQSLTLAPNELVFREGELADKMFIVERGMVGIVGRICTMGKFFGEDALLNIRQGRRSYNAVTLTHAMLYSLAREHLMYFVEQYPEVERDLRKATIRAVLQKHILLYTRAIKAIAAGRTLNDQEREVVYPGDDEDLAAAKAKIARTMMHLQLHDEQSYVRLVYAARRLQRSFRLRRSKVEMEQQFSAIIRIQSMVRRFLVRKHLEEEGNATKFKELVAQIKSIGHIGREADDEVIRSELEWNAIEAEAEAEAEAATRGPGTAEASRANTARDHVPTRVEPAASGGFPDAMWPIMMQLLESAQRQERVLEILNSRSVYQDKMIQRLENRMDDIEADLRESCTSTRTMAQAMGVTSPRGAGPPPSRQDRMPSLREERSPHREPRDFRTASLHEVEANAHPALYNGS